MQDGASVVSLDDHKIVESELVQQGHGLGGNDDLTVYGRRSKHFSELNDGERMQP